MNFDDLRLASGTVIQLQFIDDSRERYTARLMGHLEGRSVLVTHPVQDGRLLRVRSGQRVIARAMTSSAAVAFTSHVEALCTSPYPYLHLVYPEAISTNQVRRSPRIVLHMDVDLENLSQVPSAGVKQVKLLDLSPTGARLEVDSALVKIGDEIALTGQFHLSEIERTINLSAIVRARISPGGPAPDAAENPDSAVYGVEFQSISEEIHLFLQAFVYQKMLEGNA